MKRPIAKRARLLAGCLLGCLLAAAASAPFLSGCGQALRNGHRIGPTYYPPVPQKPRVLALGSLRGSPPPTAAETELSLFLFGAPPTAPLAIANPTGLAADDKLILICDNALHTVLRWEIATGQLSARCVSPDLHRPSAIDVAPSGERLLCDEQGVWRCDGRGRPERAYQLDDVPFKPAGVLAVDNAVWVTNHAAHRIEVFDRATGEHRFAIGHQGNGPGEFALPRGMARTPDGNVCVVDMLNNRVQVLDPQGRWVRNIGQAGDNVGAFGRPKQVAVGPDGTVFVTDDFSQRVHAFSALGVPLLAFGEPGTGAGALSLPGGIAIATTIPQTDVPLPADVQPAYYVLVAEQLDRPGVRAFAWLGAAEHEVAPTLALPSGQGFNWRPHFPQSTAINPHWDPTRCAACHREEGGQLLPIAALDTDALCLSCHDGVQAPADPHPIGRPARTETIKTPADWPTADGAIGCLTCHDIKGHCNENAVRPAINYVLLRGYDARRPLTYCTNCHNPELGARYTPHQQRDAQGRIRDDACFFCHTQRPDVPDDGRRRFNPHLRDSSSDLCLNCHSPHWDLSPKGHVERPVTPDIRRWMLMRELSRTTDADVADLEHLAHASDRPPALLPLGNDRVTCYTCHNPHYTGLFAPDSELGALATNPQDRRSALRTDWIDLCSECHRR